VNPPRLVIDALAARFGGTAYAANQTDAQLAKCDGLSLVVLVTRAPSILASGHPSCSRLRYFLLPC
jgi:hypothetical protein